MTLISTFLNCFLLSMPSSTHVSDYERFQLKASSTEKPNNKSTESKGAPLVVSYFPVNTYLSRL
ncbi:hypothetical protein TanjilG_10941 [Lupinus angustifolius]|uniref:Uncharacterized protein n=1 Tax=Lupinus angustifolius TaxID=3871 RepID=A0A1J7IFZ1_LUPAN|nr:hypothetical protein TanjilG_10941 [Lupinus angustifolius]